MELRLAFAMGGGVSLGTFSGAALSEVIKQAVLETCPGGPGGAPKHTAVTVDVFSGASAGAMSLAIMLRGLAERTPAQESRARGRLESELTPELVNALPPDRLEDLIAAQVVVDLQEDIWCRRVRLEQLLGGDRPDDLAYRASVLDRSAIDRVALELTRRGDREGQPFVGRRLLGDRSIFAITLASLTPIVADARPRYRATGAAGLQDALCSYVHRDIRVFDLHFHGAAEEAALDGPDHPKRWVRYHDGEELQGVIGDLRTQRAWAKICATAIASGAFPLAFEPVVLRRRRYEFGGEWPQRLDHLDEYPFTYVDGGTFNNEPLREAFRLSALLDAGSDPATFKRVVVFVDPNINDGVISYRLPVHTQWAAAEGSAERPRRRRSLDRLVPHLGTLAAALMHEATANELDRVDQTHDKFELRDQIRALLGGDCLAPDPAVETVHRVRDYCARLLELERETAVVPCGPLTLEAELARLIAEEQTLEPLSGHEHAFVDGAYTEHLPLWHTALAWLLVDILLDLEGKRRNLTLLPIAPVENPTAWDDPSPQPPRIIDLPGGVLSGFGGFLSQIPGVHEVQLGRRCATAYLSVNGLIRRPVPDPVPPLTAAQRDQLRRDVLSGAARLVDRLQSALKESALLDFFGGSLVASFLADFARGRLTGVVAGVRPTVSIEFRVLVPSSGYELRGDPDIGAVQTSAGRYVLVTTAQLDADQTWSGPQVSEGALHVDWNGFFSDDVFCTLTLPRGDRVVEALHQPAPHFRLSLSSADEGGTRADWTLHPGATPLEDDLT